MADKPIVAPTPLPDSPPVPQRNDPSTFEDRFDDGWEYMFDTLRPGIDATAANVYNNALAAEERAVAADERATDAEAAKQAAEDARDKAKEWAEGVEPAPGSKSAKGWAEEAEDAKGSAWAAAAAAGASAGLPQPLVPGKVLGATSTDTVGWVDSFKVGDLKYSLQPPGDGWLEVNRSYLQSQYPDLFDVLGAQPSTPVGFVWAPAGALGNNKVVRQIASFPDQNIIVASVSEGSTVTYLRSTDGGMTFASVSTGPSGTHNTTGMIAFDNGVILFTINSYDVYRSTDFGATWELPIPLPGNSAAGNVWTLIKLSDDRALILTTAGGFISSDYGSTWTKIHSTVANAQVATEIAPGAILMSSTSPLLGESRPLAVSYDLGESWSLVPKPRPAFYTHIPIIVDDRGWIYVRDDDSSGGGNRKVYRAKGVGAPWELVLDAPAPISALAFSRGTLMVFANTGTTQRFTYLSRNQGESWNLLALNPLPITSAQPLVAQVSGGVYVAFHNNTGYRSIESFDYDTDEMFFVPAGPVDPSGNFYTLIKA